LPHADPRLASTAGAPEPASKPDSSPETSPQGSADRSPAATSQARLAEARRRVAALKGFYIHLTVFVLVVFALVFVNSLSGGPWWVVWVFFGWGIGVLGHGAAVSARGSRAVAALEQRKLDGYLAELKSGPPTAGRQEPERPT
jgi:hypothetical protein